MKTLIFISVTTLSCNRLDSDDDPPSKTPINKICKGGLDFNTLNNNPF